MKTNNLLINPLKGGIPASEKKNIESKKRKTGLITFKLLKFLKYNNL